MSPSLPGLRADADALVAGGAAGRRPRRRRPRALGPQAARRRRAAGRGARRRAAGARRDEHAADGPPERGRAAARRAPLLSSLARDEQWIVTLAFEIHPEERLHPSGRERYARDLGRPEAVEVRRPVDEELPRLPILEQFFVVIADDDAAALFAGGLELVGRVLIAVVLDQARHPLGQLARLTPGHLEILRRDIGARPHED